MNIDLLLTSKGEAGLICDEPFRDPVLAILFDLTERHLFVEMEDHRSMRLNITVNDEYTQDLTSAGIIEIGVLMNRQIIESLQVPIIATHQEAPMPPLESLPYRTNSVLLFENFVRSCISGQPVHRENLANEASLCALLDATQLVAPQYAPKLVHQRRLEAAPQGPSFSQFPTPAQFYGPGGGGIKGVPHPRRRKPSYHDRGTGEQEDE